MATILEFKTVPRPTVASVLAAHGAGQSAEILLFPGVRYERRGETAEATPKKGKRKRDTLELES
jgi:hypothetical protein